MDKRRILIRVYEEITGNSLNARNQDERIILQKTVFLLKEMGVTIGDYRFVWDKYGPFSQSLNNDICIIDESMKPYTGNFSDNTNNIISFIRDIIKETNEEYGLKNWIEAIASFIYLKKYAYPFYDWDNINAYIKEKKPYLSNDEINQSVINCCERILNYKE